MSDNPTAKRITKIRESLALSQLDFATQIGITQGALSQLESGKSRLSLATIKKISTTFKVDCNWLIAGKGKVFFTDNYNDKQVGEDRPQYQEFIPLVREEAHAGYITSCNDTEYLTTLDIYKIPGFEHGTYRLFEVAGDSMIPTIHPREIIIAEKLEDINQVENGTLYIIISSDGIVAKRGYLTEEDPTHLILKSDNTEFKTYSIPLEEIIEIWVIEGKITDVFAQEQLVHVNKIQSLEADIKELKQQMGEVYKRTSKPLEKNPK